MNYNDNEYDDEQDFQDYGYEQQNSDNRAKNPSNILLQTTKAFANGVKRGIKFALHTVVFFITHPIILIGMIGIAGAGALFLSVGDLTSDGVLDSTDKTVNSSKAIQNNSTYKILSVSNLSKLSSVLGIQNSTIVATTAQNATSTTGNSSNSSTNSSKKKNSSGISDEAKEEYNKKGSLLLMTLDDIDDIYADYITSKTTTSEELNFMMYKVGEYEPGTHDNEILKTGSIYGDTSEDNSSGGSYSGGDIMINGEFKAFNTRNKSNVNSPNSEQLTNAQINTFKEYYDSINLPEGRKNMIMSALSLVGKCYYSQSLRQISADVPKYLDCSSYTIWAYHKGGGTASVGTRTSEMVVKMQTISKEEMIPGDVMFKHGGGEHVIIFLGWCTDGRALIAECSNYSNTKAIDPVNGTQIGNVVIDTVGGGSRDNYFGFCRRFPGW